MSRSIVAVLAALSLAPAVSQAAVTVKGSDTMVILAQRWAEAYMNRSPARKVQVTGGGSGTGIAALINGTTDIADASRPMKGDEKEKVKKAHHVDVVETSVAKDGVAIYVNEANHVAHLTPAQLKGIYTGEITNWKAVGGDDATIVLYSRENSSGTYVFVKEHVLKNEDYAAAAQTLPGTAAVVNAVAKEKHGIGYGGGAYAKGVREVPIMGADGKTYGPSLENVQSGKYALSRDLYMYTRGQATGEAKQFMDFCLSREGQEIVTKVGYYPIK